MPDSPRPASKYLAWPSLVLALIAVVLLALGQRARVGPFAIGGLTFFALFSMGHPFLKRFAFTLWVFAFVAGSMFYPQAFLTWGGWDLGKLIVPLIQIIMFGMGTTLSVADFARVFKMPWPVFIGMVLQFSVMPLTGFAVATLFGFEPAIAAGLVLIGSCPGGVASNLMAYLANGDVALSVTMTSCSTLMSPVMTPFLMKVLAGQLVPVDFMAMMLSILNMIISPVLAGLIANRILYSPRRLFNQHIPLAVTAGATLGIAVGTMRYYNHCVALCVNLLARLFYHLTEGPIPEEYLSQFMFILGGLRNGFVVGFLLIGLIGLTKLFVSLVLGRSGHWMDRVLPIVSMAGICLIIAIITARSRQDLLTVGGLLIAAVMIHNSVGYTLGYWLSRLLRLDERTCRTVAIEVGLQNGGMASALAMNVLKSAEAALAPAIFGPWMNISGSILATWWHRKPVKEPHDVVYPADEVGPKGALHESA